MTSGKRKHELRESGKAWREVAARQYGVITTDQLLGCGLSGPAITRMMRRGEIVRVYKGVYVVPGVPASWHQRLMAGHFWLGSDSAVSHRSAACLLGLDGVRQGFVELSTPRFRQSTNGVVVHRVDSLQADVWIRQGLPVTRVERTLTDLAALLGAFDLECALESALRERLTTIPRLEAKLEERSGHGRSGCKKLKSLLAARGAGNPAESPLEVLWERLRRKGGLPEAVRQYRLYEGDKYVGRVDFAYPWQRIAIEVDSWRYHGGQSGWERDQPKNNFLQDNEWIVFRYTKREMERNPVQIINQVRSALARRSRS